MKIGFIGLGIMGKPMAANLIKAGHDLVVHNTTPEPVEELVALGATASTTGKEVAEQVDVVLTMVPNGPDVLDVVNGTEDAEGVLAGAREGLVFIDMSSIAPLVSQEAGRILAT